MRLKSELYKKEQDEIIEKIIQAISLDKDNGILLYDLDHDAEKQQKVLALIPEIRKFFSFTGCIGASEPDKVKKPYLSIIRYFTKTKYNMLSCNYKIKKEGKDVRTTKYLFMKK